MSLSRKFFTALGLVSLKLPLNFIISSKGDLIRLRKSPSGRVIHSWKKGTLVLDKKNIDTPDMCEHNRQLFTSFYKPSFGDTILDLGAGIGTEMSYFLELIGPNGRLICIEADPQACELLSETALALDAKNVEILNIAVGPTEGISELYLSGTFGEENSFFRGDGPDQDSISVRTAPLEKILRGLSVDLVHYAKVNIEGAESNLVQFLSSNLAVRNWAISCHDFMGSTTATKSELSMALQDYSFELFGLDPVEGEPWIGDYVFASKL